MRILRSLFEGICAALSLSFGECFRLLLPLRKLLGDLSFAFANPFLILLCVCRSSAHVIPFSLTVYFEHVIPLSLAVYFERVIPFSLTISSALATAFAYDSFVTCSCFGVDTFWRSARFLAFWRLGFDYSLALLLFLEYP